MQDGLGAATHVAKRCTDASAMPSMAPSTAQSIPAHFHPLRYGIVNDGEHITCTPDPLLLRTLKWMMVMRRMQMARTVDYRKTMHILLLAVVMIAIAALARTQTAWGEAQAGEAAAAAETTAAAADGASIFASGAGTADDPYLIADATELGAFRDSVNAGTTYAGKVIELSADVDIGGAQWMPIGAATRSGSGITAASTPFEGTFNGAGHAISGLTITQTGTQTRNPDDAIGFFGAVMGGTVEDLIIKDANVRCTSSELAGITVGLLGDGGTVKDVQTSGSLVAKCGCGGIVGRLCARGTIIDCANAADITATGGTGNCGGIVGAAYYAPEDVDMQITDCANAGTVTGVNDTGGIVGLCCAEVSGCTNTGAVTGSGYAVGGIAGEVKNRGGITHCTNEADVANASTASPYGTGGIVGWVRYDGTAPAYASSAPVTVADNMNEGSVAATTGIGVGGIAGVLYSAGTVTGNENRASTISGAKFVAGIVGDLQDQGASTLPAAVPEGAQVVNNASATPLSAISGSLTDAYAYDNDPSIFTVEGNGTAWVAKRASTGDERYASLSYAFAQAAPDDTVALIADVTDAGEVEAPAGTDVTLELNGHSIRFAPDGGITALGGTVTVEGTGDLYALDAEGKIAPDPKLFTVKAGADGAEGHILLKGGTYPTDVSALVAPSYELRMLEEPDAVENRFEVVPVAVSPEGSAGASSEDPGIVADAERASGEVKGQPEGMPALGDDGALVTALLLLAAATGAAFAAISLRKAERADP